LCGICGVYNTIHAKNRISPEEIIAMRDMMVHRGPDDSGWTINDKSDVALGFRRLSIIDLSDSANQPMPNEDGKIWLVFNGEIYNHNELRLYLKAQGHCFKSNSDTEVIVHLYEEKGTQCVNDLDGMFAFAIYDSNLDLLFCARDRIGKKPFYYTVCNGQFIFASEIKSILRYKGVKKELNLTALYDYLTLYVSPVRNTLFNAIYKLPAGYSLTYIRSGGIRIEQYWDLLRGDCGMSRIVATKQEEREFGVKCDEKFYASNLEGILRNSVRKRMMSDVPYGVFLSGGLDSSTNVALMSSITDEQINTFTVGFDNDKYDEFKYARMVAKQFQTNHYEVTVSEDDVLEFLPRMAYYQDEPLADWVCVPLYFVAKLAHDNGVKVIQIGEGSDELFFGYDGYVSYLKVYKNFWRWFTKMPGFVKHLANTIVSPVSPFLGSGPGIREIFRCADAREELFWGGAIAFSESQKKTFVNMEDDNTFKRIGDYYREFEKTEYKNDFIQRMMYIEFKHRLPELLLMRLDKMMMATSVEGRAPYLDVDLINYVSTIPTKYKYKNGEKKYILKKAVEGLLPSEIIYRKKQGFSLPVKEWYNGKLGKYMNDTILNSPIKELGIFNYKVIKDLMKNGDNNINRLWALFNLSLWYQEYM
jgi:asparagine synthase (glutamine-hydrolysing)